jgi:hypothetical protein
MEKRIVFVGGSLVRADNVSYIAYNSDQSLLDGDIILFSVDVSSYSYGSNTFQGLRCLSDDSSFNLRRATEHWRSELSSALIDGKTVIVYINKEPLLSIATGRKEYSGTGRNARTTRIVEDFDPYSVIPSSFGSVVRRSGERIRAVENLGFLATYWHEFGDYSTYEAYIENFKGTSLLETQTGQKVVGGVLRIPSWKGVLLFIPSPDLEKAVTSRIDALKARQKKGASSDPTAKARRTEQYKKKAEHSVVSQYLAAIVSLDKGARSAIEATPPPEWSRGNRFSLTKETQIRSEILDNVAKVRTLSEERLRLGRDLQQAQQLKALLFEKGKALEEAILLP